MSPIYKKSPDSLRRKFLYSSNTKRGLRFFLDSLIAERLSLLSSKHGANRNHKMVIFANDLIGISINLFGIYEKEGLDILFDFLNPLKDIFKRGLALDVGANIGNHTIYFSKYFQSIHSFEPNPSTYYLLKFNADYLANVSINNFGLGNEKGIFHLVEIPTNLGGASIKPSVNGDNVVDISVKRLDDCGIATENLCFMKIDVEGFEANVIKGARNTITERQPLILLEQLEGEFVNNTTASISLLRDLGYGFCWHQSGTDSKNWVTRRIFNVKEVFFGRTHRVVSASDVPSASYSMLVAVPPRFQKALGL